MSKCRSFFNSSLCACTHANKSILFCSIYIIYNREWNFYKIISLIISVSDASLSLNMLYMVLLSDSEYKCLAPCWIWLPLQSDFSPSKCDWELLRAAHMCCSYLGTEHYSLLSGFPKHVYILIVVKNFVRQGHTWEKEDKENMAF